MKKIKLFIFLIVVFLSSIFIVSCSKKEIKTLSELTIEEYPNNINYYAGDSFNKDGMTIYAEYNDGSRCEITNYTYSPSDELSLNDNSIIISYTENDVTKTASISISVTKRVIEKPSVSLNNNQVTWKKYMVQSLMIFMLIIYLKLVQLRHRIQLMKPTLDLMKFV